MVFKYQPLQSNGLRLLRPVTIGHDVLAFEVSHHPRMAAPAYTAVSYTWGDGAPTERIYVNGKVFHVRQNLWSCLYYLSNARNVEWTHLWVDAICIDQTNDRERNAQVRLMDQIYRNASVVSVWLGLPSVSDYLTPQLINYTMPIRTCEYENFDWLDSMEDLANRPYWGRFWVIQECLLGQKVHLYCGNSRMDWDDFKECLGHQTNVHDYWQENVDYAQSPSGVWAAWPLVTGRHPDKHPEFHQSLYKLLITHEGSECKDPRDRVFALLGLVTLDERTLLERFFPDYKMAEDDVVIIALSHVELHMAQEPIDMKRLLLALGADSESRQRRLVRRSKEFDYLGDYPPNAYEHFFDEETIEFDINPWERAPNMRDGSRMTYRVKYALYLLGFVMLLVAVLKLYRPQALKTFVSFTLRNISKVRKLTGLSQA